MPVKILIVLEKESVPAELDDTNAAEQIAAVLPVESDFSTWGDEIYFPVPVKVISETAKDVVELGEIAFWPPGNALCIFYGATPGSTIDTIRPASPVYPLGRITGDPTILKELVVKSHTIKIVKA